jgi:hypothetical protein
MVEVARATSAAARAVPAIVGDGAEPVIDGDLLACRDVSPSVQIHAVRHGVWLAGVVEVAAGRGQNLARVLVYFVEMPLIFR